MVDSFGILKVQAVWPSNSASSSWTLPVFRGSRAHAHRATPGRTPSVLGPHGDAAAVATGLRHEHASTWVVPLPGPQNYIKKQYVT